MPALATLDTGPRALDAGDLERVIEIDRTPGGRTRGRFFEKRFAAAAAHPEDFVHVGVTRGGVLRGFAFARLLRGEFGREHVTAVLDAIGVEPQSREAGIGRSLLRELVVRLRAVGARTLHSQAEWSDPDLTHFFAAAGFKLAPRVALERSLATPLVEQVEEV
jgi:N-acetylglutamate synthase-like GNAT family acetyltransferase